MLARKSILARKSMLARKILLMWKKSDMYRSLLLHTSVRSGSKKMVLVLLTFWHISNPQFPHLSSFYSYWTYPRWIVWFREGEVREVGHGTSITYPNHALTVCWLLLWLIWNYRNAQISILGQGLALSNIYYFKNSIINESSKTNFKPSDLLIKFDLIYIWKLLNHIDVNVNKNV